MTTALVEPIVAPVLPTVAGASAGRAQDVGQGYDFAIGGLQFNIASDDDNPYQRATAQFKKDQIDTTPTPGDQSLVGYWTRGQFSFHNGGGVEYYEVEGATSIYTMRSDTVIERYNTATGVAPFKPGQVTCNPEWDVVPLTGANFKGLVTLPGSSFAVLDGTTLKYGAWTGSTFTTWNTEQVLCFATDGTYIYAATTTGASPYSVWKIKVADNTATKLYTVTDYPQTIAYVKGRLLLVGGTGDMLPVYQLSTAPTGTLPLAVGSSDKVFDLPNGASVGGVVITDSPGAILVARGNAIYAVTPDTSGALPVLSGPIQIGELPTDETILSLRAYLGYLAISTTLGVRIGALSDSGMLNYGPRLFDITTSSPDFIAPMAVLDTTVLVPTDSTVYQIDLSNQIGNGITLEFPWTEYGAAGQTQAYLRLSDGPVMCNQTTIWKQSATNYAAGTLTTGYHRFATLEPKQFRSVRVRVGGTGGTVQVSRVMADGSTVSLYTMDVSQENDAVVTLGLTAPQERVAIKFDLTPEVGDATKAPVLYGYQLNALPAPVRQRMIQVPLLCFDVEARPPARRVGHRGAAWERLSALEDMERSGATFIFQDFRTGEAGECFIESVEFQGKTPPSATSTGFGGQISLTIRKL